MSDSSRICFSSSNLPLASRNASSSNERSKWSSIDTLSRPVMMRMSVRPARTASSTTSWIEGVSISGSISLGCALVAGRNRVPRPAAGMTAFLTFMPTPFPAEGECTREVSASLVVRSGWSIRGSASSTSAGRCRSDSGRARRGEPPGPASPRPWDGTLAGVRDRGGAPRPGDDRTRVGAEPRIGQMAPVLGIGLRPMRRWHRVAAGQPLHSCGHAHLRVRLQELRTPLRDRAVHEGRPADRMPRVRRRAPQGVRSPRDRVQGFGLLRHRPREEVQAASGQAGPADASSEGRIRASTGRQDPATRAPGAKARPRRPGEEAGHDRKKPESKPAASGFGEIGQLGDGGIGVTTRRDRRLRRLGVLLLPGGHRDRRGRHPVRCRRARRSRSVRSADDGWRSSPATACSTSSRRTACPTVPTRGR